MLNLENVVGLKRVLQGRKKVFWCDAIQQEMYVSWSATLCQPLCMYTSTLQCGGLKCHVDDEMSCGGIKSGLKNKNVVIAADNDNLIYNTFTYNTFYNIWINT